jgi:plasmid stabilization system protein ParE
MEKIYDDAEAARRVIEDVLTFLVEAELVEETSQFLRNVEDTVRSNSSDTCGGSSEEV